MVRDMNFKFVLPCISINFVMQTKFEVNQIQVGHSIPKKSPKWPYLKPHFAQVSFTKNTNHGRFLIFLTQNPNFGFMCKIHIFIDSERFRKIHWKM